MTAEYTSRPKARVALRKKILTGVVALLVIGLVGLLPRTRMGWYQLGHFVYPSVWPTWVAHVLWIAAAGLGIEWITRLRKTRSVAAQAKDWFVAQFPVNPVFIETLDYRWETRWILKMAKWIRDHLNPNRFSLLVRGAVVLVVFYVTICHLHEISMKSHLYYFALDYPLYPFKQWYDAICFASRGTVTWKIAIVPVMAVLAFAWIFRIRHDYYKMVSASKSIERG